MTGALEDHDGTVSIGGRTITNLCFADDIYGLAGEGEELAKLVELLDKASTAYGMEIRAEKTGDSSIDNFKISLELQEYFAQFKDTTDALPCHIHLLVCLYIMDPYSTAAKKNTGHGNEVLPQDTMHLIQRPCFQLGSPCQDPAGNQTK